MAGLWNSRPLIALLAAILIATVHAQTTGTTSSGSTSTGTTSTGSTSTGTTSTGTTSTGTTSTGTTSTGSSSTGSTSTGSSSTGTTSTGTTSTGTTSSPSTSSSSSSSSSTTSSSTSSSSSSSSSTTGTTSTGTSSTGTTSTGTTSATVTAGHVIKGPEASFQTAVASGATNGWRIGYTNSANTGSAAPTTPTADSSTHAQDGTGAYNSLAAGKTSTTYFASALNYAVPTDATITGIYLAIDRKASVAAGYVDNSITFASGSTLIGTNHASTDSWPTTLAVQNYGNSLDTWGLTASQLTPTFINAATFGVAISTKNTGSSSAAGFIDDLHINVYYTETVSADMEAEPTLNPSDATVSTGGVIGIVAAVIAVVAVLIAGVVGYRLIRNRKTVEESQLYEVVSENSSSSL